MKVSISTYTYSFQANLQVIAFKNQQQFKSISWVDLNAYFLNIHLF